MCVRLTVELHGFSDWNVDLGHELRLAGGLEPRIEAREEWRSLLVLSLTPWGAGCGCGLVERPVEGWRREPWLLSEGAVRRVTRSLEVLGRRAGTALVLQLDWRGPERPRVDEEVVEFGELLRRVAINRLKGGRRYRAVS